MVIEKILTCNEPMTLQEIAEVEGCSHQRISQILSIALEKVKIGLEERGINIEDLS